MKRISPNIYTALAIIAIVALIYLFAALATRPAPPISPFMGVWDRNGCAYVTHRDPADPNKLLTATRSPDSDVPTCPTQEVKK